MGEALAKALGDPVQTMWHDMMIYCWDDMACNSDCGCYKCNCATHAHEEITLELNESVE